MLRQGSLELIGKAACVAFELRTDLRGMRFQVSGILFERRLRFGSINIELFVSELRGPLGELGGDRVGRIRDLLAAAIGGVRGAFLNLSSGVFDVTPAAVIEFLGEHS